MPRYFFDTIDGDADFDNEGVELPGADEAVCEAVHYAGSLISDQPSLLDAHNEFIVMARGEGGEVIARVRVEVIRPT